MKSLKCINDTKLQNFETEICSHVCYGAIAKEGYVIIRTDYLDKPFVFGFIEGTKLPQEVEIIFIEKFHKYFPNCKLLSKLP